MSYCFHCEEVLAKTEKAEKALANAELQMEALRQRIGELEDQVL